MDFETELGGLLMDEMFDSVLTVRVHTTCTPQLCLYVRACKWHRSTHLSPFCSEPKKEIAKSMTDTT